MSNKMFRVPVSLAINSYDVQHPQLQRPIYGEDLLFELVNYFSVDTKAKQPRIIPSLRGSAIFRNEKFEVFTTIEAVKGYTLSFTIHPFADQGEKVAVVRIDPRENTKGKKQNVSKAILQQTGIILSLNLALYSQEI